MIGYACELRERGRKQVYQFISIHINTIINHIKTLFLRRDYGRLLMFNWVIFIGGL